MRIPSILLMSLFACGACDSTGPTQDAPEPNPEDVPSVLDTPQCPVRDVVDLADAEAAFTELASCHGLLAEAVTCAPHERWLARADYLDPDLGFTGRLVVGRPYVACSYTMDGIAVAPVYFHLPPVQREAVGGTHRAEGYPEGPCMQPLLDRTHLDRRNYFYVNSMEEVIEGWTQSLSCMGLTPDQFEVDCWGPARHPSVANPLTMCRITRFDVGSSWPDSNVIGPLH